LGFERHEWCNDDSRDGLPGRRWRRTGRSGRHRRSGVSRRLRRIGLVITGGGGNGLGYGLIDLLPFIHRLRWRRASVLRDRLRTGSLLRLLRIAGGRGLVRFGRLRTFAGLLRREWRRCAGVVQQPGKGRGKLLRDPGRPAARMETVALGVNGGGVRRDLVHVGTSRTDLSVLSFAIAGPERESDEIL
jgi:hypothetical protein